MTNDRQTAAHHQIEQKGREFIQLINTIMLDGHSHAQALKHIEDAMKAAKRGVTSQ